MAINAYLTMLLDTGCLHCDPHPGNLLRSTDGKLVILDWGMTQGVPEDLQYALIEFIAHVNSEDYDAMPRDFVNLGFTPESQLERVRQVCHATPGLTPHTPGLTPHTPPLTPHPTHHHSPVISPVSRVRQSNLTEGLSFVLRQLSQGGGGKKITERVRAEWREKYDPDGTLSPDELRQKVREEFIEQGRAQLEAEGVENVNVMEVQNVMEQMQV